MGLFGFGKKKITETLYAPVIGKVQALENVSDQVFAQKMMGEGFGVVPSEGKIYSPIEGTVTSVFKTKHAIGFKTPTGLEVMVHMGLDTVDLEGKPFEILVQENDQVGVHTPIANMDLQQVKDAGKDTVVLTIITNTANKVDNADLKVNDSTEINDGSEVMVATIK
ncbi:N-acetylglucosamine and glucose PTS, EIICBA [Companilactobacillus mindensis DSM 14500]|uniref:N-acetylglucosamine and glucose PTS, EIICBA n=1 Tax=Companilactobacillus mindensis DSM 14500 TaxID=1423770 RepID=A0A0R1QD36_9LACO|nr:N-acetylglucosamine and glucose PTS, EIICBA [Companilactobacillus mindensis DSM 14500]GEO79452.1 PTS glucose transporter subunit IIABC [Companilactobacillus mindensis]